jgi:hypothetical protein
MAKKMYSTAIMMVLGLILATSMAYAEGSQCRPIEQSASISSDLTERSDLWAEPEGLGQDQFAMEEGEYRYGDEFAGYDEFASYDEFAGYTDLGTGEDFAALEQGEESVALSHPEETAEYGALAQMEPMAEESSTLMISELSPMEKGKFATFESRDLVGAFVRDSQCNIVGLVNELLIDSSGHTIAIINHGDYDKYGEGGRYTLVPLEALQIAEASPSDLEKVIVSLNMTEDQLEAAPFFDPTRTDDRQYAGQVYTHFGLQPYWTDERRFEDISMPEGGSFSEDSSESMSEPLIIQEETTIYRWVE